MSWFPPPLEDAKGEPIESPRLGVKHFLLWMVCAAAYLAADRALDQMREAHFGPVPPFFGALHGVIGGTAFAALIRWVSRRIRGIPFPTHNGEIYLCLLASVSAAMFMAKFAPVSFSTNVLFGVILILTQVMFAFIAACFTRGWRWSCF
ncbi:MAG: hypothetical protein N2C14_13000, partial [Planctomycetales bacterium]